MDLRTAAVTEPLSVALHAVRRAGDVRGRHVLVTGAGPIGALVVAVAHHLGAARISVSDLARTALDVATAVGADDVHLAGELPDDLADVDVVVEASGSAPGLATALERVRRGGTVVQLGLLPPGTTPFPGNLLVTREIELRGAFRFDHELDDALRLLADGLPVAPVVTHVVGVDGPGRRSTSPGTGRSPARCSSTSPGSDHVPQVRENAHPRARHADPAHG